MTHENEQVDIIAFGAHPDDVEISAGGLVAKEAELGYRVGIIDLTRGEMGSRGTPEERAVEAREAAEILGLAWRKNFGLPDGEFEVSQENILLVARALRLYRPKIIILPYWEDRHPDHVRASLLIQEAHFKAGLKKVLPELPPYRPQIMIFYFLNKIVPQSFVVDVSAVYEKKWNSLLAHKSQFVRTKLKDPALLGAREPLKFIESRDSYYGSQIGVKYGEPFLIKTPVPLDDPMQVWCKG
ncbi:MAG: bacillithiol biosynthesis deacetylase BshB1 [Bacillota bacterium]